MKLDVNAVVKKLGRLEGTLKKKLESGALVKEARRYADGQVKALSQKVKGSKDAKKVVAFIEKRKKDIEKMAKDLPAEVKNVRSFVEAQRKELEKIGNDLVKKAREGKLDAETLKSALRTATSKKAAARTASTKKVASKKSASKKAAPKKKAKAAGTKKKASQKASKKAAVKA